MQQAQVGPTLPAVWKSAFLDRAYPVFETKAHTRGQASVAERVQVLGRLALENEIVRDASTRLVSIAKRNER